ncbi:hypothetical protein J2Y03_001849 [Neobacillus niacini]|uniref:hypothetical protein n=1 Tax=Neobacillus niacini TaxID=86668 RepID=UPI00286710AE|nr:hypothetical protein [Neobacillus niacini]MDR7076826.1 hypothetical protein [Neobacillus niacini]
MLTAVKSILCAANNKKLYLEILVKDKVNDKEKNMKTKRIIEGKMVLFIYLDYKVFEGEV